MRRLFYLLSFLSAFSALAAEPKKPVHDEKLIAALATVSGDPSQIQTPEYREALAIYAKIPKDEILSLNLPDEAVAWVPTFGPCGGEGSVLLMAFCASYLKDKYNGKLDGSIYRGWLVAIRHYQYYRKLAPEDVTPIPSLEQMIKDEASNRLREKAAVLEKSLPKR